MADPNPVTTVVYDKKWWQSKTIALNAVFALLNLLAFIWPDAMGIISQAIHSNPTLINTIWGFANVALRFITKGRVVLTD